MILIMDIVQQKPLKLPFSIKNAQNRLIFQSFAVYKLPYLRFPTDAELRHFTKFIKSIQFRTGTNDDRIQATYEIEKKRVLGHELKVLEFGNC